MDFEGIEKSSDGKKERNCILPILIAPVNAGQSENRNSMFRRLYPKSTDLSKLNPQLFIKIQTWMNNYPRKLLKGSTPETELQKCIGKEFTIPI